MEHKSALPNQRQPLFCYYCILFLHAIRHTHTQPQEGKGRGGNGGRGKFTNIPNDLQQQLKHVRSKRQPPPRASRRRNKKNNKIIRYRIESKTFIAPSHRLTFPLILLQESIESNAGHTSNITLRFFFFVLFFVFSFSVWDCIRARPRSSNPFVRSFFFSARLCRGNYLNGVGAEETPSSSRLPATYSNGSRQAHDPTSLALSA